MVKDLVIQTLFAFALRIFVSSVEGDLKPLNLNPQLLPSAECYIYVISYKVTNFHPPVVPIVATSLPRFNPYVNDTSCTGQGYMRDYGSKFTFSYNPDLCPYVLQNYQIKGIKCLSILALYADVDVREEDDIHWYLNHFWSRADLQEYAFFSKKNQSVPLRKRISFPPLFPTNIHIQTVLTREAFDIRSAQRKRCELKQNFVNPKREVESFTQIPIITIVINSYNPDYENWTISVSLPRLPYFASFSKSISENEGLGFGTVRRIIKEYRKANIKILISSRFREPLEPQYKFHYPGVVGAETVIHQLLSRRFNESQLVDARKANSQLPSNTWKLDLTLKHFVQTYIGSNTHYLPVADVKRGGLTCAGQNTRLGFHDYAQAYSNVTWMALFFMSVLICFLFYVAPAITHSPDLIPFLLVSILVEVTFPTKALKFKSSFSPIIAMFVLLGLVLSNGYKGTVITSLVKPFDASGLDSLEAAIKLKYDTLGIHAHPKMSEMCCNSNLGLNLDIRHLLIGNPDLVPMIESGYVDTCGDFLVMEERLEMLYNIPLATRPRMELFERIARDFFNFNEDSIKERKVRGLVTLSKSIRPLQCNQHLLEELGSCNYVMHIDASDELKRHIYMEKFNPTRKYSRKFYLLEDTTNILSNTQWGILISPINLGRDIFHKDLNLILESGIHTHIHEEANNLVWLKTVEEYRFKFGNFQDQTLIPNPLNLNTKIRVLFYLYAISILCVLVSISMELVLNFCKMSRNKVTPVFTNLSETRSSSIIIASFLKLSLIKESQQLTRRRSDWYKTSW